MGNAPHSNGATSGETPGHNIRLPHHPGGRDHPAGAQQKAPPLDSVAPLGERVAAGAWALLGGVGSAGGEPVRAGVGGVVAAAGVARSPHPSR
eukprot:2885698-Prymnesium_polylepis.1